MEQELFRVYHHQTKKDGLLRWHDDDLERRLEEHWENKGEPETFAGKYYCYNLVYYERLSSANHAIEREKEIKLMNRVEKEELIKSENPRLLFFKIEG